MGCQQHYRTNHFSWAREATKRTSRIHRVRKNWSAHWRDRFGIGVSSKPFDVTYDNNHNDRDSWKKTNSKVQSGLKILDMLETCKDLAPRLRKSKEEKGEACDLIFALTHALQVYLSSRGSGVSLTRDYH